MMKKMANLFRSTRTAGVILLAVFLACTLGCEPNPTPGCGTPEPSTDLLPIVFVHGMAGSADQFSLQAQRFISNGYPADLISGFEYDTTLANNTVAEIMTAMDAHIDAVLAKTGASQVDLAGHSMGTMMSQRYLTSNRQRAAKVAHYVNIDGMTRAQLPGGVPTLAIWASLSGDGRSITGATNVTLPGQTHVQSCTSAEAFAEMYKFFTGEAPETVDVLPENAGTITLAGKMTTFLTNAIPQNYSLDIYEVNAQTGMRTSGTPAHTQQIKNADGSFKFAGAKVNQTYEFAARSSAEPNMTLHFYYETTIRGDLLMRLKVAEPGSSLTEMIESSANQTNLTIVRDKELVGNAGDRPAETLLKNDSLTVDGTQLCSKGSTPIANATIGLEVYDAGTDRKSNATQSIQDFASIPFIGGIDLFIQASTPPQDSISVVLKGRQNGGVTQVINVPNWSSTTNKVTVQFRAL